MYIEISDYVIRTLDKYNIVLAKKVKVQNPESAKFGKIVERRIGYYPNLEMALNSVKNKLILRSEVDTVEALLTEFRNIAKMISDAVNKYEEGNRE